MVEGKRYGMMLVLTTGGGNPIDNHAAKFQTSTVMAFWVNDVDGIVRQLRKFQAKLFRVGFD